VKTILCLHSSADLYGSDRSLLRLVTGGLPFRFIVVLPYEGPLCAALREKGVAVQVYPLAVIRRRLFTPWGLVQLAVQLVRQTLFLRRLVREEKVDLLMANTTAVLGGEWAAALCGRPYLQYVREIIVKPKLVAKFLSWRARWATRVLCVSEGTRNHFVAQDPVIADKTFVLNNGIEVGKFEGGERAKVRKEWGIEEDTVLVGAIGRISPFKGMDFLVDAAAAYFRAKPEARVRFVVVGSAFGEKKPVPGSSFLVPGCGEGEGKAVPGSSFLVPGCGEGEGKAVPGSSFLVPGCGEGEGKAVPGSSFLVPGCGEGEGKAVPGSSFLVPGCGEGEGKAVPGSSFLVPGCGEGELLPAERALVDRMAGTGFGNRISWQPFRADVADVLAALDIFVLPSMLPDPLPTVVLEAMAAGRPVIGTRMGGVPEMVVDAKASVPSSSFLVSGLGEGEGGAVLGSEHEATGVLVTPGDVAGLAGAIGRLVEDAGLREKMGLAGARRCREHFSVERYLRAIPTHLSACMAEKESP
jgi:glycosyltransferase involved in cell wall biosynthesis